MRARITAVLALAATAQFAMADNAKPRGGGGSSSSAGSHHSSSSAHSSNSGSSGSSASSGSSSGSSPITDAERRHPRAGTGTGYRSRFYRGYPYYRGYYNSYYGYYPYSDFYFYGGYAPYYYGSPYGYGYGYRRSYRYADGGSLRLLVEPDQARVYVDGYYAGIVDDFDGLFQRLNVPGGRHEITLKLEGYRAHRVRIYLPSGETMKIHYTMIKGSGEDEVEDLAGARYGAEDRDPARGRGDRYDEDDDRDRDDLPARDDDRPPSRGVDRLERSDRGERAELRLSVRPADASVYVDGQFRGSGRQVESLTVSPGRHRIEVVRPGFRTFEREVQVDDGRPAEVDVELERP